MRNFAINLTQILFKEACEAIFEGVIGSFGQRCAVFLQPRQDGALAVYIHHLCPQIHAGTHRSNLDIRLRSIQIACFGQFGIVARQVCQRELVGGDVHVADVVLFGEDNLGQYIVGCTHGIKRGTVLEIKAFHLVIRHIQRQQVIGVGEVDVAQLVVGCIEMEHRQERTQLEVVCIVARVVYGVVTDIDGMEHVLIKIISLSSQIQSG